MSDYPIIAISIAGIANRPENHEMMQKVGPKVCIATARAPGFLGFEQLQQVGVHPMAGRWGGGALHMMEDLNPFNVFQYTVWEDVKSHEAFHHDQFDVFFELCHTCLGMVVDGPWEPLYEVVDADLANTTAMTDVPRTMGNAFAAQQPVPPVTLAAPGHVVTLSDHWAMAGREAQLEAGLGETMRWLKENAPGLQGWMLLKQIGVSAIGSFMLDPDGQIQPTLGANPPAYNTNYGDQPLAEPPIPPQTPTRYFIHADWETVEHAHQGWGKTLVNHELMGLYNEGVRGHIDKGPYHMVCQPFMEEGTWRRRLPQR
jgi:sulfur oxygenase/reductase